MSVGLQPAVQGPHVELVNAYDQNLLYNIVERIRFNA